MKRIIAVLLALCLSVGGLCPAAHAALSMEYPQAAAEPMTIPQKDIDFLAERLKTVKRDYSGKFQIIDAMSGDSEKRSTDYTARSLNAYKGIVTVTEADRAVLRDFLAQEGLAEASDAEKLARACQFIHNELVYDAYHTGSYVYSGYVEKGGQCNIYNGALCAMANYLGYEVQIVRGYRASTGSAAAHWWGELVCEDGTVLVLETGNLVDGEWYYLGSTYEEIWSSGRNYVKCDRYPANGEPYEYLGAAVYPMGAALSGTAPVVSARIWKGAGYTVTEAGLLLADETGALQPAAKDAVDAAHNAANDSRGFSVYYDLAETDIPLTPGETLTYAFYLTLSDGTRIETAPLTVTVPEAEAAPAPVDPADGETEDWLGPAVFLLFLFALLALALFIASRRHAKKQREKARRAAARRARQAQNGQNAPAARRQDLSRRIR